MIHYESERAVVYHGDCLDVLRGLDDDGVDAVVTDPPSGGTVLEPFAGSGTTVEACILEGFRCVAIEREADYLPLVLQRIQRRLDPVSHHVSTRADDDEPSLFDLLAREGGAA